MTALLSPNAKQVFLDNAGNPAAGYKLFTYAANTTTPLATYTNRAGTVANANPIILDARGEATIYLPSGAVYDYVLKTAADVTVWTREDVEADPLATDLASSASGSGAALVSDQRTELTNSKARTLRSRGRDQFFLAEILPQSELEAIANRASTYDATQELRDALSQAYSGAAYQIILPPGTFYVSDDAPFAGTKHIIGQGRIGTNISTSSTTKAILRATGGGNHRIAHIGFRRHAGTPTAGSAIDMTAITGLSVIEDVYVADMYDGIRLGTTDLGFLRHSVVENTYNHGVVRTTENAAGNIQWRMFDVLVQKTEGHGFFDFAAPGNGNSSTGEILQCYTYACKLRSYAAVGSSAAAKINSVRLNNCFFGESGAGEVYLDTYGSDHVLDNLFVEISGAAPCGRNVATPATNAGHGIEITANNGPGTIANPRCYNNAYSGIVIAAPDWTIANPDCRNNGRAAGTYFGLALNSTLGVYQVQGGRCMNDSGITQQDYGIAHSGDNLMLIGVRLDGNAVGPIAGGPALVASTVLGCYPSTINNVLPGNLLKGATAYTNP